MKALWRVAWQETLDSARLLFLLSVGLALLAYAITWEYPDFRERMLASARHIPPFFRHMVMSRSGALTLESFARVAYVHPVALALLASWPIARASRAVASEIELTTLGWHLAYPIGRLAFLWGKALPMLAGVVVMQVALCGSFLLSAAHFHIATAGPWPYVHTACVCGLLYMAIGTLTLWVSAASSRTAVPGAAGAALVLLALLQENVGGIFQLFENTRWLSLYHYFDYEGLMAGNPIHLHDVAVLAGVALVGLVGASLTFWRRDLAI